MKKITTYYLFLISFFFFNNYAQSQDYYSLISSVANCGISSGFVKTTTHIYVAMGCNSSGFELYVSDGTEPLRLVKQINATGAGWGADIGNFLPVGNKLYFTAKDDGQDNAELWMTDATEAGTKKIREIASGSRGSYPSYLTEMNGIVYFVAYSFEYGQELWRTDGTTNGTYPIIDMDEGSNGGLTNTRDLHAHGNTIYFCGRSSNNKFTEELYKTDGTESGTVLIKDINTVPFENSTSNQPSFPKYFFSYGNIILFTANDGIHGTELWKTDGTTAGTVLVKDINSGAGSSNPAESDSHYNQYILYKGEVYFAANDGVHGIELWKTDGTENGTVMVKDLSIESAQYQNVSHGKPCYPTIYKDKFYFYAYSSSYSLEEVSGAKAAGYQVWESDGTSAGTTQVTSSSPPAFAYPLRVCNDLVYFNYAYNASSILMKYDGAVLDTVTNKTSQDKYLHAANAGVCFNNTFYFNAGSTNRTYSFWEMSKGITTAITHSEKEEEENYYIIKDAQLEILTPYKISEIKVITAAGSEIAVPRLGPATFDVSALPAGMYIIKTNTDEKTLTKKIVLVK
ncbi:ELWxxDGT repeat protein [Cytophaga hutchinsonii]|uniref:Secretion system C-terminal sorting domain-containing protein n=1 Tax=Cytophaga hutchinsonii (strain ATCC 33406 / DSM 1761 / CIP 103989 / NBRC 15051 / NCIMB 9469 / D465) TaxID=269798 RepID=A0A6N4SN90_CYTH3|nr:ELWxxDGT repeat protein [Cytophaga hutchinsonii]ABG57722.1 conserved hypothetical protein [Cytophaga hutchinsonii ATCC 33406]SFX03871.1 Por secretion system C-terminal sorting domain-containing protein [Cytophaga hutchinsonii ATCC 33406]